MGDDSWCDICRSRTSTEDKVLLKHIEDVLDLKPYVRDEKEPVTFEHIDKQIVIRCRPSSGILNKVPLRQYKLEDEFPGLKMYLDQNLKKIQKLGRRQGALGRFVRQILNDMERQDLSQCLTETNYVNRFHILLWIEEHYAQKELERHNQRGITLITGATSGKPSLYGIDVLGLSDGRPSLIINDFVRIHKKNEMFVDEKTDSKKYHVYEGLIEEIKKAQDEIYVAPNATKFQYQNDEKVGVEFLLNRRPYQLSHRALEQVKLDQTLNRALFPKKGPKEKVQPMQNELDFVNKKILNDEKQMQAIGSIIRNTSGSAPYILIGPPGTGKTATLVEAVYQLWKRSKSASELPKICICAPSNPAIDVIVKRLLGRDGLEEDIPILPAKLQENVMRVYAKTVERDRNLLDCSMNEVDVDVLREKRIIATTTITAGWLVDKGFGRNWFDYLFIDEAGQGTETNILIPIAGFLHDKCHLVLAGDPKQLGPVVTSPLAKSLRLDVSLMERLKPLKGKSIYASKSNRNSFLFTAALNNNYRSHQKIIHIPNTRFYHGQLKAKGETKRIFLASDSDWEELALMSNNPKQNKRYRYPIIFHGVAGEERQAGMSPSYLNLEELIEMKNYIYKLLGRILSGDKPIEPENIGIISPYRSQVEQINKYLNHLKLNGIQVGSVESFQGSEKPIIIISTARSMQLGCLGNARRFNVAITRAIALLIVIGHPEVLYSQRPNHDPNYWREFIDECYRFRACKGKLPEELEKKKLTKVTVRKKKKLSH